jgi:hypothetical protein
MLAEFNRAVDRTVEDMIGQNATVFDAAWHKGGEDGIASISSGRWMPVRVGALSAKGLAPDGLQLPLQGLPAFLRSGLVHIDDRAQRGFRPVRPNRAL